ncbi:hypothetical protein ACFQ07_16455 [Actinomadura adrarensis]|uniref:Uncharacterized protein n=1 Tax=Actinomadura adrarensis TaxID=1819600 RepID=A0ABW3CJU0_9ACTN
MYVILLPDGTLRVPHGVLDDEVIAQGYVEVRPGDPDYDRLRPGAITAEEMESKRATWRAGDEDLLRMFEQYKAATEDQSP